MTTVLALRFPLGRYHATPWGRSANEGVVEWPPSPWRILRALYATWQCRLPELSSGEVVPVLEALTALPTFRLPPHGEGHTRHYLPARSYRPVGEPSTDKALDAFVAVPSSLPAVATWPVELEPGQRQVLAELLEVMPYLGRADSVVEAHLVPPDEDPIPGWSQASYTDCAPLPNEATGVSLLLADAPLDIDALVCRTIDVRRSGRLDPPGARRVTFNRVEPVTRLDRPRRPVARTARPEPVAVRFAVGAPALPLRHAAVAMGDALRQAAMSRYGALHEGAGSSTLAGKEATGQPLSDHQHAHYLALPEPDRAHLSHLVVWAPGGLSEDELVALATLRRLHERTYLRDFRPCRLALETYGSIEDAAPELVGQSRAWVSLTPFAPTRYPRKGETRLDHVRSEVAREVGYRALPAPADVTLVRGDWSAFRTHRITERLRDARRAFGVRVQFSDAIAGPVALGALSHFGLGIFVPEPEP